MVPADDGAARKLFNGDDLGLTFYTQLGIAWPNLGFFLVKRAIWPWMAFCIYECGDCGSDTTGFWTWTIWTRF